MIWRIGQFPELRSLSDDERQAVLAWVSWLFYPKLLVRSGLVGLLLSAWLMPVLTDLGVQAAGIAVASAALAVALAAVAYLATIGRERLALRATIEAAFAGERPPFCFRCGYDLRGSAGERCPECGGRIEPLPGRRHRDDLESS